MFLFWGYFPCCASLLIRIHYRVHLMSSSISLRNHITKRRLSMYLSTGLIKLSFGQCVDICLPSCSAYPWGPFRGLYQKHTFPVLHQAYQSPLTPMMVSTSVSLCSFLIALVDCSQHEAALKSESWDFLTIPCLALVLLKKYMFIMVMHVPAPSRVWLFATPWAVSCQVPLSLGFPGKNTGVGCHFLLQWGLPDPGIKPMSPALQVNALPWSCCMLILSPNTFALWFVLKIVLFWSSPATCFSSHYF